MQNTKVIHCTSRDFQCSECVDNFLGKPTDGHQCYRQMIVDRDFCFDPNTQMNCHSEPEPLMYGRTVFFGVQPKYLNVDIRVTLDVTSGGMFIITPLPPPVPFGACGVLPFNFLN